MPTIPNSTVLDLTSYCKTTATTVEAAYHVTGLPASQSINVAFQTNFNYQLMGSQMINDPRGKERNLGCAAR